MRSIKTACVPACTRPGRGAIDRSIERASDGRPAAGTVSAGRHEWSAADGPSSGKCGDAPMGAV